MTQDTLFNVQERRLTVRYYKSLLSSHKNVVSDDDVSHLRLLVSQAVESGHVARDSFGFNPIVRNMYNASLLADYFTPDRNMTIATLMYDFCHSGTVAQEDVKKHFGDDIDSLISGLLKVRRLYDKQAAVADENFQKLLLTFASDIRVIIIMIVDRLGLLRMINHHPNENLVHETAYEARYLYAPLAHRLGLYGIKSELEDISLKYLNRKIYDQIAEKLHETKTARDEYVVNFIRPIKEALCQAGLKCDIKGRTKSINSIWNKMRNKGIDLNDIYDLFAIRIILDSTLENEKRDCWTAYSIVTDKYTANTSRMRDWITLPKSNGYESLHITVSGPDDKWVEVQIRTQRMDEIAEKGLAAHWKYKGIKSEGQLDALIANVREVLEAGKEGQMQLIRGMHMNIFDDEVFVFTPRGDVFRLPQGASIIDFAYAVHTKVGHNCIGGKVDGKNQKLNYRLKNGDTVEVLTSSSQVPRQDWLKHVVTSRARNKIKSALNEERMRRANDGRELIQRRFRNRKLELDEAVMTRLMKKLGFKTLTDFLVAIGNEDIPATTVVEQYENLLEKSENPALVQSKAEEFVLHSPSETDVHSDDILLIGESLKGVNYRLSKCCNPVPGDGIVGFVASSGTIKVHRTGCRNVKHLLGRYPYRGIRCAWTGKDGASFRATLHVTGRDEMGILANITSVINKTDGAALRSVNIESRDTTFDGNLVVNVTSLSMLDDLIKKINNLKGVKAVTRL